MITESGFSVPYTKILKVEKHSNADALDICTVYGFQVIVRKDSYKVGDYAFYVPIDSVLPEAIEKAIFPEGSKITLHNHRVRQIRIRKLASQGMLVNEETILPFLTMDRRRKLGSYEENEDVSVELGITKYEPPTRNMGPKNPLPRNKVNENPRFHEYNGVTNIKWMPNAFDGQEVIIQEKLHGSCLRVAYLPTVANTLWRKILKLLHILPKYEFCYGSNRVQLQQRQNYTGWYGEDVYGAVLERINAFSKIKPGETLYLELIGEGIQANYHYGHKQKHHAVLYDVKIEKEDGTQEFLDPEQAEAFANERGFDFVPVLFRGMFDENTAKSLATGPSVYYPLHKIIEGVVVKRRKAYGEFGSKHACKLLNEEYLDNKSNTDFH